MSNLSDLSGPAPFSQPADRNKGHILEQLQRFLIGARHVLEIASGTGQHALHFTDHLPDVLWQPSDLDLKAFGLEHTLSENLRANMAAPLTLDISRWPDTGPVYDAVYSANCLHVIDWPKVVAYVSGAARSLKTGGLMMLYGPFNYGGAYTSEGNASFDETLKQTYEGGGIRDFEAVNDLAQANGLSLLEDVTMPANNRFLVWRKSEGGC